MEKIKSILHPHKDKETAGHVGHDTKHTAAQSSTGSTGATVGTGATPIYNQMTGPNAETPKFSTTPNVGTGTTSTSTDLAGDRHIGSDSSIGDARAASSSADNVHLGANSRTGHDTRPQVSSGAYDGNSEASIKSGVIGFAPGQTGQGHAALPSNTPVADKLDHNQVVGQGNANTNSGLRNEVPNEQPSILPVSSSTHSSSTHQPHTTDRSFPLSGGVTSGHNHSSSTTATHGTQGLRTNERELGTESRELEGADRHGREALAGAAAAAAGTAAATQSHHTTARDPQVGDRISSPTGHTHLTSSVKEHNIHPDALHAAGARPVNDSTEPGHGPPYETPHINTGTLLDYEKAYGSDPHTQHTGLLGYRPHAHRSDTSPHIPGEFPEATPDNERAGPILGAGTTTVPTSGPSTSHDLRHTGSLTDTAPKSAEPSGHHLGRDAAVAGGVGAAGLGVAAAHQKHEPSAIGTGNLYDEKNPYNSKALDPRVTGGDSRLDEQKFESTAKSSTSAPIVPNKAEERQHHYGRDVAIGGGALGVGALAGSALSGDRHRDSTLRDSSSLPTTQHTTGTSNPSTVGTTSTSHQLPSATTGSFPQVAGEPQPQHHYGRDAGLAGAGIGAATAAGLSGSRDQPTGQHTVGSTAEDPASKTIGPHTSNIANILDPRVQPDPAKQKDHTTTGPHKSDTLNKADPKIDDKAGQHHYGRDAAVVGGAGAAGYGAYEAANAYGDQRSTQPGASMQEQRYDPSAVGARAPNPVPATSEYNYHNPDVAALASTTGAGATGHQSTSAGQPYTTAQMAQSASSQPPQAYKTPEVDSSDLGPKDNSSRNAALGAGAGLAGASALGYGIAHHGEKDQSTATSTKPGSSSLPQPTGSLTQGQRYPDNTEPSQSHTGRDAALAGGAGAAAGAGAGYAYGQRTQPHFDPKEQERLNKETAKRQHDLEKKHDKDVHKLEKEHEKDLKKHEKEAAKEEKKSGGLLGFLHRDKSKKEKSPSPETSPRQSGDRHYGRDAAVAGGAVAGGAALAEHEREDKLAHGSGYKGKNLLHKDPPANHPAAQALHANDRVGVDGPIGSTGTDTSRTSEHHYGRDAAIGGGALGAGALGAHELSKERTEPSTLSSSTTGAPGTHQTIVPGQHSSGLTGNQTTLPDRTRDEHHYGRDAAIGGGGLAAGGLAAHELHDKHTDPTGQQSSLATSHQPPHNTFSGKREHVGIDGPIGDPNMISGDRQTQKGVYGAHPVSDLAQDHTIIEPRTGLPMNVGRYGDGAGGTDGDGAGGTDGGPIGHRQPLSVQGHIQPGTVDTAHAETDWEDVAKKNTIY